MRGQKKIDYIIWPPITEYYRALDHMTMCGEITITELLGKMNNVRANGGLLKGDKAEQGEPWCPGAGSEQPHQLF